MLGESKEGQREEEIKEPRTYPKYVTQNERNKANSQKASFLFVFIYFTLVCQGDEVRTSVSPSQRHVLSGKMENAGPMGISKLALIYFWGNGLAQRPQVPPFCFFQQKCIRAVLRYMLPLRKGQQNLLREGQGRKKEKIKPFP